VSGVQLSLCPFDITFLPIAELANLRQDQYADVQGKTGATRVGCGQDARRTLRRTELRKATLILRRTIDAYDARLPVERPGGHTTTDLCVIRPLWPLTDPIPGLWRKPSQITGLGFGSDNSAVIRNIIKRDNPDNKPG
jgi:hypothetical protein